MPPPNHPLIGEDKQRINASNISGKELNKVQDFKTQSNTFPFKNERISS